MGVKIWWLVGGGVGLVVAIVGFGFLLLQTNDTVPAVVLVENDGADLIAPKQEPDRALVIEEWYAPLYPMRIGSTTVYASVADTPEARTKGLSGTPYLPLGVVKLFVFDESKEWSFWMKDMNYAIDIVWVNDQGVVVHIESAVSPASYPNTVAPPVPAKYVIELQSGFVRDNKVSVGDMVVLPRSE